SLGSNDRTARQHGELDAFGAIGEPRVPLLADLHINSDDLDGEALQLRELAFDVRTETVRHVTVTAPDHNVHSDLLRQSERVCPRLTRMACPYPSQHPSHPDAAPVTSRDGLRRDARP